MMWRHHAVLRVLPDFTPAERVLLLAAVVAPGPELLELSVARSCREVSRPAPAAPGALDDVDTGAHTRDGGLRRRRVPRPNARGSR